MRQANEFDTRELMKRKNEAVVLIKRLLHVNKLYTMVNCYRYVRLPNIEVLGILFMLDLIICYESKLKMDKSQQNSTFTKLF